MSSDPRHHTDANGGRHSTHVPFSLSDTDVSDDEDGEATASFLADLFDDPEDEDLFDA